ncbi:MAG: dicarboxylate/amino acid:cation symporter [Gemmatimonadetes bacterium]|nr:dicarboxylate/amino acid:cation symporter [Gemmatimonadota bacterium]MCC6770879.1 dicarboxylate/amino acid:cation symporter [Gemmatimonadaceae bacterium]
MKIGGGPAAILSLVGGFAVGSLASAYAPSFSAVLLTVSEPVGTLWVNAIRMTVVPLVIALLVTGVDSLGDLRVVGRMGGRALATFVGLLALMALCSAIASPPMFERLQIDAVAASTLRSQAAASGAGTVVVPPFSTWLTSLIPVNPVAAAADGAMLPLIVFTVAFALAVSTLPADSRAAVVGVFRGTGEAMLGVVRGVLWFSPVGIGALAITLGAKLGGEAAGLIGFYLVAQIALLVAGILLLYPIAIIGGRVAPGTFARAMIPAQVVAMSTRSSLASLPALLDSAERTLHVRREVAAFVLPFGVAIFRLSGAITWVTYGLFISRLYDLPFGALSIATLSLAAVVMNFAVPGIPSGGLLIITPIFVTLGLPPEAVGLLIAVDAIPDFFKTVLNVTAHMTALVIVARGSPPATAAS